MSAWAGLKGRLKPWLPQALRETTYPFRERLGRVPGHLRASLRIFTEIRLGREPIRDLARFEQRFHSQNGEDGIIAALLAAVGATNRYCVEFGLENGEVCNTRRLRKRGWQGLWMDPAPNGPDWIKREFVTAENVNALFDAYAVPSAFDLLSIDVDGNDYWIWKAISGRRPRIVLIEYNASLGPQRSCTIAYDPAFRWDRTDYYGASLEALRRLGAQKGYALVACDSRGVNAFFVARELAERFVSRSAADLYRPLGHPHRLPPRARSRTWIEV